ncbi:tetratricopeptide repeat protein [Flavisolibacter sp. BT320]|nr:tetratricopeptide repeat protein [Flavisolibacter longurius]
MGKICSWLFASLLLFSCSNEEKNVAQNIPSQQKTMDSIATQINAARSLQESGQTARALAIADSMLQKFPGQLDAIGIKAEILKEQGKNEEALALLEKAYTLQPRDKETAYNLAYEYAEAKSPKALSLTDTLIKYDKTETVARAWYIKASYFRNLGNEKEALRYYDSSAVADYNFLDTYLDKGQLQFEQKKFEAALRTFATGQKLSPGTADFYFWVAKTQQAMGNTGDAKMNYERAFALDKSMTEAKAAAEAIGK